MIYAASASAPDVKYGNKEVFINFPLAGPSQHQAAPSPGDHMMGTHSVREGPSLDTTHAVLSDAVYLQLSTMLGTFVHDLRETS